MIPVEDLCDAWYNIQNMSKFYYEVLNRHSFAHTNHEDVHLPNGTPENKFIIKD